MNTLMKSTTAFALVMSVGTQPLLAQMVTEIGPGEGQVNIVAWPGYIERGEIRPVVSKTYPLREIIAAQQEFLGKGFTGKLVLLPPE